MAIPVPFLVANVREAIQRSKRVSAGRLDPGETLRQTWHPRAEHCDDIVFRHGLGIEATARSIDEIPGVRWPRHVGVADAELPDDVEVLGICFP